MTSRNTCPSSCSFFGAGCYAEAHLVGFHWNNVAKRGDTWASFCASVRALPVGQLWRHNTAGDLPGDDETVDERLLGMLVDANRGRCGFTFTHCKTPPALAAIRRANDAGFTINLSADSLAQADLLARTGAGPVVVVIPSTSPDRGLRTPEGRHVVVCPAQRDKLTCATCRLCALPQRKSIIGFRAHGVSKARVDALVTLQRKPRPVGGMLLPPPPTESARRSPSSRSGPTFGLQSRLAPMPLCPEPKGPRGYACGRPAIAGGYCVWHALLRSRQVAPPPPDAAPPPSSAPATTPASAPRPTLLDETFAQAVRRRLEARGIHLRESIESPGGILTIVAERLGRRQVLAVRPIGAHYALSLAGSTLAIGDVVQRLAEPWTQRRSKGRTRAA
jgi:hypothetical protein